MATSKKKRKSGTKTTAKASKAKPRASRREKTSASRSSRDAEPKSDSRHQFVALAMRIGTEEAQRLLDAIVDVQTPTRRH